jgi:hypothetical protein
MKPLLILLLLVFTTGRAFSQNDLLVLKQHNKTIQTWIPGSTITFQYSSKQWIEGIIKAIRNDSILIEQIILRRVANQFGFLAIDTAKMGLMKLHVKEIYGMPKRNSGGSIFTNGALFMLGSGAYIFANLINTLIHKDALFDSQNGTRLGVAGGIFIVGALLQSTHSEYVTLGRKYTIETIHLGNGTRNPAEPL